MEELKRVIKQVAEAQQQHNVNLWYKPDNFRRVRAAVAQITKNTTQQELLENKVFEVFIRRNESKDMVFKIVKLQILEAARDMSLTIPTELLRKAAALGKTLQAPKFDSMQEAFELCGREYADKQDFVADREKEGKSNAFYAAIANLSEVSRKAIESYFDSGGMISHAAVRELMTNLEAQGLEIEEDMSKVLFNLQSFGKNKRAAEGPSNKIIQFPSHKVPFNPVQLSMFDMSANNNQHIAIS